MRTNLYLLGGLALAMSEGCLTEAETNQLETLVEKLAARIKEKLRKEAHHG